MFTPILDRYGVLQQDRPYIMAFYIRGLMAIISEWLKNDCADSITWCCTIKVDIENSKGQYIEKDKQEATKDGSESTKIQHGI